MTSLVKPTLTLWLAGIVVALGGCTQLDLSKGLTPLKSKPKPRIPERMVDAWTDTVLHQSGQRGVRGFGGRVMFYAKDQDEAVAVDGTFTVYAFDDSDAEADADADPDHQSPDKKYVFSREQLAEHYSKSPLGHSYSFWIPWDEVGGEEKRITLISRFVDGTSQVIMSKPCRQTLPGIQPKAKKDEVAKEAAQAGDNTKPAENGVRHASFDTATTAENAKSERSTATIDVPPSFARRLQNTPDSQGRASDGSVTDVPQSRTDATTSDSSSTTTPSKSASESEKPSPSEPAAAESAEPALRATRSAPSRFPARRERAVRQSFGRVRTEPHPAAWPSALPRTPRPERSNESSPTLPADAESPS